MRQKHLQIIRWLHITLILALILPCLYAGDIVAREPIWNLHLKGLLLMIPVVSSDLTIQRCKNLFIYMFLCAVSIFVMIGAVLGMDCVLQLLRTGVISEERDISVQLVILVAEAIAVMIGRFVGRADFSEDNEDEEEILRKPVSKSILNEPSPNMIIYFVAVYLLGWILRNNSLCNEALFSVIIYLLLSLWYRFVKATERYLALNRRIANLPGKRVYYISGCVMAMFLIGLAFMTLPAVISIPVRNSLMGFHREVEYKSEVIQGETWEHSILTEGAEAMWARLGAPESSLPKWLDYVAVGIFICGIFLILWLIYGFFRKAFLSFRESFDENGDQMEELRENSDLVSYLRSSSKEPGRNDDIRKRYRKIIRKHRKERPGVYESPTEIETGAGLAGEPEMQKLHVLYERVRYGR